jgi:hypothetical protein
MLVQKGFADYQGIEKYLPQKTQITTENSVVICVFCGKKY